MAAVFLPVAGTPRCHRLSDSAVGLEPSMSALPPNGHLVACVSVTLRDKQVREIMEATDLSRANVFSALEA
jgi:hypothetical protein